MNQEEIDILKRALAREKASRKAAEEILEAKSAELYDVNKKLEASHAELINLYNKTTSELQGIFENIIDAYVIMDINGNVLKFNEAATELFGHNVDEESINVVDLIYKDDYQYAIASFLELKTKGFFKNYEARVYTKNKEVKWVHINASLVLDNNGIPMAAQGIVRDITETKRINQIVQEQKRELDVIVNNSSIGIALTEQGDIKRTNEIFQNMLGYTEEEITKLTIKDLSLAEDYPESKVFIEKMNAGELDNFVINKRYKKKDGSIIWAKTNVNAVRDTNRNIKFQVALIEDITSEREKTLIIDMINNLTKSILGKTDINEIAWEIVNNIADYLDSDDCVIYLVNHENNTLEQVAVYGNKLDKNNHIINKMILPIGKGIVGDVVRTGMSEVVKDTTKDNRYIADDDIRYSEITVPIIRDGKVIAVIDSEHKDKNYYTKQHVKALESIGSLVAIKLRTALSIRERKKAEERNAQLLSQLEKSNDELQEYAHIVSHDLKSPLRSIDALVSWIKEDNKGKLDDVTVQNFGLIEKTLEKMEQLISDILLYSSISSETKDKSNVDLNILIDELKQILYLPEKISITILNQLPIVIGDKTKFQQLFQNLISNAIKFNDKDKGFIEIDVIEQKSYYQFSIKDNGIGIEKENHDKIFKIFHALQNNKESTGIGLSIVKKVVDLYKGEIWLESKPNIGTTFYFTIKK